jgi:hypothetical protein
LPQKTNLVERAIGLFRATIGAGALRLLLRRGFFVLFVALNEFGDFPFS